MIQPLHPGCQTMPEHTLLIPDLNCDHCVRSVTAALRALDPQAQVQVKLSQRLVQVITEATPAAVALALTAEGYPPQVEKD
ncbi:heavy-metal-associated domain-containing protein [Aquariibacter albus]|nr:heavy-metal-associated domain-containing protein [Aquariibacter albus]